MPNRSYSIEVTARGTERGVTPGTLELVKNFHGRVPTDEILVTFYLADLSLEFLEAERAIIAHDGPPGAIVVDAADTAFEAPGN